MKTIKKPWIKLKENIDRKDYDLINTLQVECINKDKIALKLELEYKLGITCENSKITGINNINEFMYFDENQIVGYAGICSFGGSGSPIEVNGMVHPEYRRQGVFKTLSELVAAEWKRRGSGSMLLLSDRKSASGQKFIKGTGAKYKHTEYEMFLKGSNLEPFPEHLYGITFRKATNIDSGEIARQNEIYFNDKYHDSQYTSKDNEKDTVPEETVMIMTNGGMILPEDEEKRGVIIYLAENDKKIIGKVHLQLTSKTGGIYGLGVLPEYRGKGFGRAILMMVIEKLKEVNASEIMLQVDADNANALKLYKSCGFVETSAMDYYEMKA